MSKRTWLLIAALSALLALAGGGYAGSPEPQCPVWPLCAK